MASRVVPDVASCGGWSPAKTSVRRWAQVEFWSTAMPVSAQTSRSMMLGGRTKLSASRPARYWLMNWFQMGEASR